MINLIIVEDESAIREQIKSVLVKEENEIKILESFSNAEDFLLKCKHNSWPTGTVILMDLGLPGKMKGIQAIHEAKKRRQDLIFVVFTKYDDEENLFDALSVGATSYIWKNDPIIELFTSIREAHNGFSRMSPHIAGKLLNPPRWKKNYDLWFLLSEDQQKIITYLAKGLLYKEIADKMGKNEHFIGNNVRNIYEKLCGLNEKHNKENAIIKVFKNFLDW